MKNIISRVAVMATLITVLAISSCKDKMDMDMNQSTNIDYPAAYVINGESGSISIIKLSDNSVSKEQMLMTGSSMIMWPHHIYINPAKSQLAIGVPGMDLSAGHSGGMAGMKGSIVTVDPKSLTITKNIEVPVMNHNALYVNNGTEIWTTQMEDAGKVLVYDANTYSLMNTITVGQSPAEVTLSADGSKVYVANGKSNTVSIINPTTKVVITTISVPENPVGAWPGSIGKMFVDCEDGQKIVVLNVATDAIEQTIDLGFMPGFAAHLSTPNELWVTNPMEGKVAYYTWDASMNMYMLGGNISTGAGAHAIGFNNGFAYVSNQNANTVSVIKTATHTVEKTLNVGKKPNGIVFKN